MLRVRELQEAEQGGDEAADGESVEAETGDAIAGLFHPSALFDTEGAALEAWQSLLQPCFPEWQNNLTPQEAPFQDGTYILKVSLGDVWRRIALAGDMDLEYLCGAILRAFDFDNDHLYAFYYQNKLGVKVEACAPMSSAGELCTEDVLIGEMELEPGGCFEFLYDFGDNWRFRIELERIDAVDASLERPKVIESHGKAPRQYRVWDEEYESEECEDDEDGDDGGDDEPGQPSV